MYATPNIHSQTKSLLLSSQIFPTCLSHIIALDQSIKFTSKMISMCHFMVRRGSIFTMVDAATLQPHMAAYSVLCHVCPSIPSQQHYSQRLLDYMIESTTPLSNTVKIFHPPAAMNSLTTCGWLHKTTTAIIAGTIFAI